eukprot:CAMPEP_0172607498 /NCGR_PEP_ID=MMETSP1068-20121228/27667_1 /TAXON_ID=35684 /ORGANISM="Pseudopedinella elastica, Strain CCMP716" /LENGTH=360 /DNA_ID=CAMNT_0013410523 /DNA_START=14 /DNA_END=1096 /DNA_ORIENTATION=-
MMAKLLFLALALAPALAWSPAARAGGLRRGVLTNVVAGGENRALVIQNKGGGHGELGYHLALLLAQEKGCKVTVLHDGGPEPKTGKNPFDSYANLEAAGVEVKWTDLGAASTAEALGDSGPYEFVFDNWSKDASKAAPTVSLAKSWKVSNYVFVSSAGMYKGKSQPMTETDEVKETGQRAVEELLASEGLPWTSFRPQYIYGPLTNKRDYIDWFFHRIERGMPLPIPNAGDQVVCLTNAVDVASLLASALGNPDAVGEVFNCGTDACVTYSQVANMAAELCGKEAKIVSYDPSAFELPKGAFPFRNTAFYVSVDKAKSALGWSPKCNLKEDLTWYYQQFKDAKLGTKEGLDFSADEKVLA